MDKPTTMSVKDFLIRKLAVKLMVGEKTIEAVVNHQFSSANEALEENNSIEVSGFGKFYFNRNKALKKIETLKIMLDALNKKLETEEIERKKELIQMKIKGVKNPDFGSGMGGTKWVTRA